MRNRIPYHVICAAKKGDEDALKQILKHYEPLIVDASKRMIRTDKDTLVEIVDEEIRAFIESELVLAIINTYDPYRMPSENTTKPTTYRERPSRLDCPSLYGQHKKAPCRKY